MATKAESQLKCADCCTEEDFEEWSDEVLEEQYALVKEFVQKVDDCIAQFN